VCGADILHLVYNLIYPAVLGAFVYEVFFNWHDRDGATWSRIAAVLVVYMIDFLLAKKLYEGYGVDFLPWQTWLSLVAEVVTLVTLNVAFHASGALQNAQYSASWFFGALGLFSFVILAFYQVLAHTGSVGRVFRLKVHVAAPIIVGSVLAGSLVFLMVDDWNQSGGATSVFSWSLCAIALVYYWLLTAPGALLDFRISVSGSVSRS
jgi:hypothetical protein